MGPNMHRQNRKGNTARLGIQQMHTFVCFAWEHFLASLDIMHTTNTYLTTAKKDLTDQSSSPSCQLHGPSKVPASSWSLCATKAGSLAPSCRRSSDREKVGTERASSVLTSASRRDRVSATIFCRPGLYSTQKSKPRILLTQACCKMVERRWSNRNFRL